MDSTWMVKQMIDFQQTAFNSAYNAFSMARAHSEKVANTLFEQALWLPEESKRIIGQWADIGAKGQNDFKTVVDENFTQMGKIFSPEN